jgi:hypothetical protein
MHWAPVRRERLGRTWSGQGHVCIPNVSVRCSVPGGASVRGTGGGSSRAHAHAKKPGPVGRHHRRVRCVRRKRTGLLPTTGGPARNAVVVEVEAGERAAPIVARRCDSFRCGSGARADGRDDAGDAARRHRREVRAATRDVGSSATGQRSRVGPERAPGSLGIRNSRTRSDHFASVSFIMRVNFAPN